MSDRRWWVMACACAAAVVMLSVRAVGAQDGSSLATPGAGCTVEPRSEQEIARMADLAATPGATTAEVLPEGVLDGEEVAGATLTEISDVLAQVKSCQAAGDLPRLLALYTDAFVVREVLAREPVEIVPGTPRAEPGGEEVDVPPATFELDEVSEARSLGDGRVVALVGRADDGELVVFAQEDDQWRIDAVSPVSEIGVSPVASPAGGVSDELLALPPVQAAIADAVARLGVAAGELTVESVGAEVWPDASLGCPEDGQFYAQVETPGYRVVIAGGGQRVEYHTDESGIVVACEER